jgi:hypothetical protein
VNQSVATLQLADGLEIKIISLTVFTDVALTIVANILLFIVNLKKYF